MEHILSNEKICHHTAKHVLEEMIKHINLTAARATIGITYPVNKLFEFIILCKEQATLCITIYPSEYFLELSALRYKLAISL